MADSSGEETMTETRKLAGGQCQLGQARFFKGVGSVRGHVITLLDAGQILAEG
jgi:hypothetical protein